MFPLDLRYPARRSAVNWDDLIQLRECQMRDARGTWRELQRRDVNEIDECNCGTAAGAKLTGPVNLAYI